MKNNLLPKFAFILLAATLLVSCSTFQSTERADPPLRMEFTQWWGDYPLLVAKEKGYFEEYGADVEPVYYPIYSEAYPDLAAGQIDAAFLAIGDAMNVNRHLPVKVVLLEDDGGYMPIVARPEIIAIQDLRGKKIGTLVGTQYELLLEEMLASAGMTSTDVFIRNVNPEEVPAALASNQIQAGFTWEPITSQALAQGAHVLYPTNANVRLYPDALVFRQETIEGHPDKVRAIIKAWFKAVDYSLRVPEETRQIAAQYLGVPAEQIQPDTNLKLYTYQDNVNLFSPFSTGMDSIYNVAQKNADYLVFNGVLSLKPDVRELLTPDFLAEPE